MSDHYTTAREKRRDEIVEAIIQNHGSITAAANALGISRSTIYNYKNDFPEIEQAIVEAREVTGDLLKGKLIEMALAGNLTAIIFALKTQYGWRETNRLEIDAEVAHSIKERQQQKIQEWRELERRLELEVADDAVE